MNADDHIALVDKEELVDVEEHALSGTRGPDARQYRIRIDDKRYKVADPVITGRQILDKARLHPADEYLVFQVLNDGMLEDIRLDETVDLRRPGLERFITFKIDRSFRFVIDGRRFEWGAPEITGMTLKNLAEVDPETYDVWLEVRGEEDRKIENKECVRLDTPGVEKFFTGKKTTTEG